MAEFFENISEKLFEYGFLSFLGTAAVMVICATWLGKWIGRAVAKSRSDGKTMQAFLFSFLRTSVFVLAAAGILMQIIPLKNITVSLLAGSSIVALAISLASQDAMANLVGGIFISVYKPFSIGQMITVDGVTGTVEDVNLRHTVIRTYAGERIILPNNKVNTATIQNYTLKDEENYISLLVIPVACDTDIERAMEIMSEVTEAHPGYVDVRTDEQKREGDPAVTVMCTAVGPYSADLRVTVRTADRGSSFGVLSDLRRQIIKRFGCEGISMPAAPHNIYMAGDKK